MFTDPSPIATAASAFLAGIALSILAFLAPDLFHAVRDLRRPRSLLPDDRAVEHAISARVYSTLAILGVVAIVIALLAFSI